MNGEFAYIVGGGSLIGILTIAGFSIATYKSMGSFKEETSQKRARIYERLDEVKKEMDEKKVSKDICMVLHKQLGDDITDIKADLKLLLKKNGIEK